MSDNPWIYIGLGILIVIGVIVLFAFLVSLSVTFAAKGFSKKTAEKYTGKLVSRLPGKDCGECGYKTCTLYAEALLQSEASEDACPHGDGELHEDIKKILKELFDMLTDPTPPRKRNHKIK